jgi:hypothetical protein
MALISNRKERTEWQRQGLGNKEYYLGVEVILQSTTATKDGDCFCSTRGKRLIRSEDLADNDGRAYLCCSKPEA